MVVQWFQNNNDITGNRAYMQIIRGDTYWIRKKNYT